MKLVKLINSPLMAIVDDDDYERASEFNWYLTPTMRVQTNGRRLGYSGSISLHRFLLNFPVGVEVDHKDVNPLNNMRSNLRVATKSQNSANSVRKGKKRAEITSRYSGVTWDRARRKWIAKCGTQGAPGNPSNFVGRFDSETDAAIAYNNRKAVLFGDFGKLNIVRHDHA